MNRFSGLGGDIAFSLRAPKVRLALWGFFISLAMLLLVVIFYWLPAKRALDVLRASIEDRRREIHSLDYGARLAAVSGQAASQVTRIEKQLEVSSTQSTLIGNLAALARKHNVTILSESYEEGKAKDGYSQLTHSLTIKAGYREIRSFIFDMQNLPSFTVIQEAVIGQATGSSLLRAQLGLVTYRKSALMQP